MRNVRCKILILTGEMDFGRMDSHTSPARMSVTDRARVKISALDCELGLQDMEQTISVQARQTASDFMAMQVRADLEASATAAIPETARLRRTATREAPPTRMGRPRTSVSLLRTQLSTHSCRGRSALLTQHPCSRCRRRRRTESLNPINAICARSSRGPSKWNGNTHRVRERQRR